MADTQRRSSGGGSRRQPSRLQRRAPATLQINRSSDWKVAIPLLSPLVSPSSPQEIDNWTAEMVSREGSSSQDVRHRDRDSHHQHQQQQGSESEKPAVFKKWQHPAAPFHYESGPRAPRFVPV